jgi:hypothetical protein
MLKKPKGWYKELVIRPVVHVDGYESYEKMCEHVANVYFFVNEENIQEKLKANHRDTRNPIHLIEGRTSEVPRLLGGRGYTNRTHAIKFRC